MGCRGQIVLCRACCPLLKHFERYFKKFQTDFESIPRNFSKIVARKKMFGVPPT